MMSGHRRHMAIGWWRTGGEGLLVACLLVACLLASCSEGDSPSGGATPETAAPTAGGQPATASDEGYAFLKAVRDNYSRVDGDSLSAWARGLGEVAPNCGEAIERLYHESETSQQKVYVLRIGQIVARSSGFAQSDPLARIASEGVRDADANVVAAAAWLMRSKFVADDQEALAASLRTATEPDTVAAIVAAMKWHNLVTVLPDALDECHGTDGSSRRRRRALLQGFRDSVPFVGNLRMPREGLVGGAIDSLSPFESPIPGERLAMAVLKAIECDLDDSVVVYDGAMAIVEHIGDPWNVDACPAVVSHVRSLYDRVEEPYAKLVVESTVLALDTDSSVIRETCLARVRDDVTLLPTDHRRWASLVTEANLYGWAAGYRRHDSRLVPELWIEWKNLSVRDRAALFYTLVVRVLRSENSDRICVPVLQVLADMTDEELAQFLLASGFDRDRRFVAFVRGGYASGDESAAMVEFRQKLWERITSDKVHFQIRGRTDGIAMPDDEQE